MRYGVLADVHGNLDALLAALALLAHTGAERYLVAGDIVGYGPHPNECVEIVAGLDATCVAGNHDLIALGRLADARCSELARRSLAWTSAVLRDDVRAYLAGLPTRAEAPGGIVLAHGSIDDPQAYSRTSEQAVAQLRALGAVPGAHVLVLGHTHRAWAFALDAGDLLRGRAASIALPAGDEPVLLNPGAVGQSRSLAVRARCLLLDLDTRSAEFLAPRYDTRSCRRALRLVGLPARSYHVRPSLRAAARRVVRAAGG